MKHIFTGNGAPDFAPTSYGQHYIDVNAGEHYNSVGTTSVEDWKQGGSGTDGLAPFYKLNQINLPRSNDRLVLRYHRELEELKKNRLKIPVNGEDQPWVNFQLGSVSERQSAQEALSELNYKFKNSKIQVDLSVGLHHHHSDTSTERPGSDRDVEFMSVHPLGRIHDANGSSYNLTQTNKRDGAVVWGESGEIWWMKSLFNPDRREPHTWFYQLPLNPGEYIKDFNFTPVHHPVRNRSMGVITTHGRVFVTVSESVNYEYMPTRWVEVAVGSSNLELSHIESTGKHHNWVVYNNDLTDLRVYTEDQSGFESMDLSLDLGAGETVRWEHSFVFKNRLFLYLSVYNTSPTPQAVRNLLIRFDDDALAFTVVREFASNATHPIQHWTAPDDSQLILSHGHNPVGEQYPVLLSTDGVVWSDGHADRVIADSGKPVFYKNASTALHLDDNGVLRTSEDGQTWTEYTDVSGMSEFSSRGGWVFLQGYDQYNNYRRSNALSFVVYRPDRGFTSCNLNRQNDGQFEVEVVFQPKLEFHVDFAGVPEELLYIKNKDAGGSDGGYGNGYDDGYGSGYDNGYDSNGYGSALNALNEFHANHYISAIDYSVSMNLDNFPFGIDPRLITFYHYIPTPDYQRYVNDSGHYGRSFLVLGLPMDQAIPDYYNGLPDELTVGFETRTHFTKADVGAVPAHSMGIIGCPPFAAGGGLGAYEAQRRGVMFKCTTTGRDLFLSNAVRVSEYSDIELESPM